jgi:CBS domain-containing protein
MNRGAIMAQSSWESLSLSVKIQTASTIGELTVIREHFLEQAQDRAFIFSEEPLVELATINEIHDQIIRKVLLLVEKESEVNGWGKPPVAYDFVLFGSGGRSEQTLWSDQDNGIIYDIPPAGETSAVADYFIGLGQRITDALTAVGYPPCEGGVLCRNKRWCRSVESWEAVIMSWFKEPGWEQVRYLLITADMRCLRGEGKLTEIVRNMILEYPKTDRAVADRLLHNTLRHKMLVGIFGQFLKEQYGEGAGGIDIKYGAYIPFINGIRLLAILQGIRCSSTTERLKALEESHVASPAVLTDWREAFTLFIHLRAKGMHRLEDGVWVSSGLVKLEKLSKQEVNALKRHQKTGKALQRFVKQCVESYQE